MRAKVLTVCALAVGAAGGWFAKRVPAPVAPEPPAQVSAPKLAVAPMPRPARNERIIPLAAVYGTRSQPGTKTLPHWGEDGHDWSKLREAVYSLSQHAVLVSAPTVYAAGDQAAALIRGDGWIDELRLEGPLEHNKLWAVVSFGTFSGTHNREVLSIVATDDSLTVNYRCVGHPFIERIDVPHAFVVPLGKPKPGWFTLRLFDVDEGHDTRVVRVYVGDRPPADSAEMRELIRRLREKP